MKKTIKLFFVKFVNSLLFVLKIAISIGTIFAFYMFFRWTGIKGLLSFVIGMSLMAWLLLSKNMIMQGIISMTGSEDYIDEIRGKTNEEKNKPKEKK